MLYSFYSSYIIYVLVLFMQVTISIKTKNVYIAFSMIEV